jgi:endonuclease-3
MLRLSAPAVERAIYPVGFYRNKARTILELSRILCERFGGEVPRSMDELLALKGVGRKTANLVLTQAFGEPAMCVDTHVHRISNRWGYVHTRNPRETETALRAKLPRRYWMDYNDLLVALGQTICHPTSPRCSACPVERWCAKRAVVHSR